MNRRAFLLASAAAAGGLALVREADAQAKRGRRRRVVAIDAGHGGKDPGAIGAGGTHEKEVTLAVALKLARRLEATGRYAPTLIRDDDDFVSLAGRVDRARRRRAELFLSLHADSIPGSADTRGFSVYTLSETASDAMAGALAARENEVDRLHGLNLKSHSRQVRNILLDLLHRETANNSLHAAHRVLDKLSPPFSPLPRPHRQANFAVLRAPDVPSVLVEMGFLSNREDERALRTASHQNRLAERLSLAVDAFFDAA